jgi:hypothetical protein
VIFGLRAVVIVGLRAVVYYKLETSPCGEVLPKFLISSLTHAISSLFVQSPSAGSNIPTIVSPAADPVNPSPQSGLTWMQSPPP